MLYTIIIIKLCLYDSTYRLFFLEFYKHNYIMMSLLFSLLLLVFYVSVFGASFEYCSQILLIYEPSLTGHLTWNMVHFHVWNAIRMLSNFSEFYVQTQIWNHFFSTMFFTYMIFFSLLFFLYYYILLLFASPFINNNNINLVSLITLFLSLYISLFRSLSLSLLLLQTCSQGL